MSRVLLFDLDGTLLRSDRTVSQRTLDAIRKAREKGWLIGVSTSRAASNSLKFTERIDPDIVISSGGALVTLHGEPVACQGFEAQETAKIIETVRNICGNADMTADTAIKGAEYYRNYVNQDEDLERSWGVTTYTDFRDFNLPVLKMCVEIADEEVARQVSAALPWCDCIRFTDGLWYKFTKAGVTKETAIWKLCEHMGISTDDITAFGDDLADIGMLKMCGLGVAMGNAGPEVKAAADIVIGSNDEDGIAAYLEQLA